MKLFILLALLIIIPMLSICMISNWQIVSQSKDAIGKNYISGLKTADESMQRLRESLYKDSLNLSRYRSVTDMNNYSNSSDGFSRDEMINLSQILDTMVKMVQTDESYYSIYLYLENFSYTITTDKDLVKTDGMTDKGWITYYKDHEEKKTPVSFIDTRALNSSESLVYVTTYIYPLTPYITSLDGAVVINVRENAISKMINGNIEGKDGSVLIINSKGDVVSDIDKKRICSNISKEAYISQILESESASGYFSSQIDSNDYLVSYYKSGINDWIYVGLAPTNFLTNSEIIITQNTVFMSLILMMAGVLIAFIASKKIYSPVNVMVKTIKSSKLVNLRENEDDMSVIYKALGAISKGYGRYAEKDRKKLQENCVIKLLGGDFPDDESKNLLGELFNRRSFICAVISIDEYNETAPNYEEKQWSYIKSLLLELSEEILKEDFQCIGGTIKKGEIFVVCNMDESQCKDSQETLRAHFSDFQKEVAKVLDNTVTIGIGNFHSEMTGIRESYIEARTASRQKLKLGLSKIIIWNDEWNNIAYYYPFEAEAQIQNCLDLEMKEKLTAKLDELIEDLKNRQNLSCENIVQIAWQLTGNTIIKYMIERRINFSDFYGINSDIYSEIAGKETLDEIRDMLISKYLRLIDFSVQMKNQKKSVDSIIEYIEKNYKKDIGLNDISAYVGLSYSHVRKIFKKEMGVNIVDYLNSMRIEEAKSLLPNKKLSINHIAMTLGYNNVQSFERYFKKFVGINPIEFRAKKQQQEVK